MFGFFKKKKAETVAADVVKRLNEAAKRRRKAGGILAEGLIRLFPEADASHMLVLSVALTDRLVERHWKEAAPAIQVEHLAVLESTLGKDGAVEFIAMANEVRAETDVLLDELLDKEISLGRLQGFADLLGEAMGQPTINGFDPLMLSNLLELLTDAELLIRPERQN